MKNKYRDKTTNYSTLFFVLFTFIITVLAPCNVQSKEIKEKSIKIVFKNQVETIGILQHLWVDNAGGWPYANFANPVKEDISSYFKNYAKHKAVLMTKEIANSKLSFSGPLRIALMFSSLPNSKIIYSSGDLDLDLQLKENMNSTEYLNEYLKQVNLFYNEAQVDKFLDKHKKEYNLSENEILKLTPDIKVISIMEKYYGTSNSNYYLVPSLTLYSMSIGTKLKNDDNSCDLFQITGAFNNFDSAKHIFGFSDQETLYGLSVHEYGHSFVNTTPEMAEKTKHLEPLVAKEMAAITYSKWETALEEHIVRAIEIRIFNSIKGMEQRTKQLRKDYIDKGFKYIPFIEKHLAENYENNRKKYPTFEQYIPMLINAMANYSSPKKL